MTEFSFAETGKRIKYAREKRGLSIEELSSLISCSPSHLDKTEKGQRGMSIDLIFSISVTLNVSMNYLTNCPVSSDSEMPARYMRERLNAAIQILNELAEKQDGDFCNSTKELENYELIGDDGVDEIR